MAVRFATFLSTTLKSDKVNGERHVGSVFQFRMEIKQTVVRINPLQDILDTEALAADMLHQTFVVVIDGLHDQPYQQRGLAAEFRKVDFLRVVRPVHRLAIMDEVFHLDIQLGRLVRILHIECIIAAVIRDHRQIRFTEKSSTPLSPEARSPSRPLDRQECPPIPDPHT